MALQSVEILFSSYLLCNVPIIIIGRELSVDLVILEMVDYDIILGIDFLGKYKATIKYKTKMVSFNPPIEEQFEFIAKRAGAKK